MKFLALCAILGVASVQVCSLNCIKDLFISFNIYRPLLMAMKHQQVHILCSLSFPHRIFRVTLEVAVWLVPFMSSQADKIFIILRDGPALWDLMLGPICSKWFRMLVSLNRFSIICNVPLFIWQLWLILNLILPPETTICNILKIISCAHLLT